MENNDYKEKVLPVFEEGCKEEPYNNKKSLEASDDLFIDVGPISCITGPILVLNDKYRIN